MTQASHHDHEIRPANQRRRIWMLQSGAAACLLLVVFSRPAIVETSMAHEFVETIGVALILVAVFGRLWSILYIGSRKNAELVTSGPYSITRNPLYLFSTIGAIGIGLVFGSIIIALVLGTLSYAILAHTASKEATYLHSVFGAAYRSYAVRTPMIWPKLSLYRDQIEPTFSPATLRRTFVDCLFFLAIYPLIEGLEYLQVSGNLPTALWLY
ncbi:methyltransferase family protein [Xanthobacter sp. TB0136]|uniref:methyltransferase family protein n=1 Tax=Xanthobacter sp. TB0136 TaxID=3459177 RepID=UPI00143847C9|nr:isoprenylcysteine carboxylmethyltransferase family protein [Ochrobactrum sp. MC-1LL]